MFAFLSKLRQPRVLHRVLAERLTEPLHINALAALVAVFGSFRAKAAFDLILRPQHAYGLLSAADRAKQLGLKRIHAIEFGVAQGAGLMNMALIGQRVQAATGVEVRVVGMDTGQGMPPAVDYRDHPDLYWEGCFPMDADRLRAHLPDNAELLIGDLEQIIPSFLEKLSDEEPVGYIAIDVDYYSSTCKALDACLAAPGRYLPCTWVYLDDIHHPEHNDWCGELLAIREFNEAHQWRKIQAEQMLRTRRIMKNPMWIDQMYILHVLDHPVRSSTDAKSHVHELENPYLRHAAIHAPPKAGRSESASALRRS